MKNNPIEVGNLAVEIFMFDHTFIFSDDYRVWKNGEIEKAKLIEKVKAMNLSISDKILMITLFTKLWNSNDRYSNDEKPDFESTDENSILWPLKSSMYEIAGITKQDHLFISANNQ